jgi:hypothetical protein
MTKITWQDLLQNVVATFELPIFVSMKHSFVMYLHFVAWL